MKFTLIFSLFLFVHSMAFADGLKPGGTTVVIDNANWSNGLAFGMGMFSKKPDELKIEDYPQITVKIGYKKDIVCNLDSISKSYVCPNDNDPILIKHSPFGFMALGRDRKNSPASMTVSHVEADGKTLYEKPNYGGGYPGMGITIGDAKELETPDLARESIKINIVDEFLTKANFLDGKYSKERIEGSPEYNQIAQGFIEQRRVLEESAQKAYNEKNYSVELDDGQKINCERGGIKELTKEMKNYQEALGQTIKCGSFKCDPVVVDGKTYDATMIFDSNRASMISGSFHLTDKDGMGPTKSIRRISSPSAKLPLVDNSAYLDNKDSYYGGSSMASMLPASIKKQDREKIAFYKDPTFDQILQWYQNVCSDNTELNKLSVAKKQLVLQLAYMDLAEFIQVLADGSLVGNFVDPSLAPQLGCLYQGVYLNEEAAKNLSRLKKNIHPDKLVEQTISLDRATELFNKAAGMKDIAWKYKPDGCYARAHLMARRFEAEGVRVDKVWIKGDLFIPGTAINWNFHVAPVVYVEDAKGKIQKMVIDPALFEKPVTVEEWDKKMSKKTARGSVITAFPFPENSAFMERSTLSFSSSDPYLPRDSVNMTEEDKLGMAEMTMSMYKSMEPN